MIKKIKKITFSVAVAGSLFVVSSLQVDALTVQRRTQNTQSANIRVEFDATRAATNSAVPRGAGFVRTRNNTSQGIRVDLRWLAPAPNNAIQRSTGWSVGSGSNRLATGATQHSFSLTATSRNGRMRARGERVPFGGGNWTGITTPDALWSN